MKNILSGVLVELASLDLMNEGDRKVFSDVFEALKLINDDKKGENEKSIIWWLDEAQRTLRLHDLVEYHDALVHEIDALKVEITKLYQNL